MLIYISVCVYLYLCISIYLSIILHYLPQILQGDMAQFSIWDRPLTDSEVHRAATCKDPARGNVFSSDSAKFEEFGVQVQTVNVEDMCRY